MCVVSMIMDHHYDKWRRWLPESPIVIPPVVVPPTVVPTYPAPAPPAPSPITPEEIEEFRKLLERAREYDRRHNEPDCEQAEKRERLKKLAKELGVEIDFV